jgi:hypothetical protein
MERVGCGHQGARPAARPKVPPCLEPRAAPTSIACRHGQHLPPPETDIARVGRYSQRRVLLLPDLWGLLSETQRQQFGVKYGRFVANGDQDQAELARELLDSVDAAAYLPEPVRVAEIAAAIDDLLVAHRGIDNFYAEPSRARLLESVVGDRDVPEDVRHPYVLALVEAFLTNGHGVAWNAEPSYRRMIENFGAREAEIALLSFTDKKIASRLQHALPQDKFRELLEIIEPKLARRRYREIVAAVRDFTGPLYAMSQEAKVKRLVRALAH